MPRTKIFCDIADSKTIKEFNKKSIVDGFTTNPRFCNENPFHHSF